MSTEAEYRRVRRATQGVETLVVTLPITMARALKITAGQHMKFSLTDDSIVVTPVTWGD